MRILKRGGTRHDAVKAIKSLRKGSRVARYATPTHFDKQKNKPCTALQYYTALFHHCSCYKAA